VASRRLDETVPATGGSNSLQARLDLLLVSDRLPLEPAIFLVSAHSFPLALPVLLRCSVALVST